MTTLLLVIHLLIAIAMVGVILLQRSEGGALGIGGGGMSGFMTGRATANLLTRVTAGLAVAFFITSMTLALLASSGKKQSSILEAAPSITPIEEPVKPLAPPAEPSVPLAN